MESAPERKALEGDEAVSRRKWRRLVRKEQGRRVMA